MSAGSVCRHLKIVGRVCISRFFHVVSEGHSEVATQPSSLMGLLGRPSQRIRRGRLAEAFRSVHVDQVVLEHCTLGYGKMTLWDVWNFKGEFAVGVIDQRSDQIESVEQITRRTAPALERVSPDRLLLTSECGFQHVPLEITRAKLRALAAGAEYLRGARQTLGAQR
jgi:hypothetical protein